MQKQDKSKDPNEKGRAWTIIVYPGDDDTLPDNWLAILQETFVEFAVSPLHDRDVNEDGELKKPHHHILLLYPNTTTYRNVKSLTDKLNSPFPQKVLNTRAMVQYMVHQNSGKDKFKYNKADIKAYNGLDIEPFFEPSKTERMTIVKDISEYVIQNEVTLFSDLVEYILYRCPEGDEWFDVVVNSNTLYINKLIDSVWRKRENSKLKEN